MGIATAIDGTKYDVPTYVGETNGISIGFNEGKMEQNITVAKSFRKGSKWLDAALWSKDLPTLTLNRPEWKISRVETLGPGHKKVHFSPIIEAKKPVAVDPAAFTALVKEIGLTDQKLHKLLESMLVNVFIPKTLLKLEKEDHLEFIMDEYWIFLKAGDTAYRV